MSSTQADGRVVRGGALADLELPFFQERESMRHKVAEALRSALVAGEMRPGVVYTAPTLAEKFGVSATPVREAMLDLAKEGLVQIVRNKGFRVTELSDEELDDITALRALIETPTVGEVAAHCKGDVAAAVEALRPLAQEIVDRATAGDLVGYVAADTRLHLSLLSLTGNRTLVEVVANLRAKTRLYGLDRLAHEGRLVESAHEHTKLLDAILTQDRKGSMAVMRHHLGHVRGIWAGTRSS